MHGRVLIVAGSDSGGGAGIQADIKTVTALSGYAMTVVTALTAQNTEGVFGIHEVPADFVEQQLRVVLSDLGADCVKVGMLHRADIIDAVCAVLGELARDVPIVVDPVMVAKGGHSLLAPEAVAALKINLVPMARVVTPNLPEAQALAGDGVADRSWKHCFRKHRHRSYSTPRDLPFRRRGLTDRSLPSMDATARFSRWCSPGPMPRAGGPEPMAYRPVISP